MYVAVVIPCLNEQDHIAATVRSLGFDGSSAPPDADLILVDNASTDRTLSVLGELAQAGPADRIHRLVESVRGFVPPRHRGVRHAGELARARGVGSDDMLILQADADTIYRPNYIERMRAASSPNALLEGAIGRSGGPDALPRCYRDLELQVDRATRALEVDDDQEVLIDDKACGYRLSDYLTWGGLTREYSTSGSEIHAETTRMYLRALGRAGARRQRVEGAEALTSARRIREDPALYFSTAGFPRERGWIDAFQARVRSGAGPMVQIGDSRSWANRDAIRYRIGHNLVLFAILPRLVSRMLNDRRVEPETLRAVLSGWDAVAVKDLCGRPGLFLTGLLALIDDRESCLHPLLDDLVNGVVYGASGLSSPASPPTSVP